MAKTKDKLKEAISSVPLNKKPKNKKVSFRRSASERTHNKEEKNSPESVTKPTSLQQLDEPSKPCVPKNRDIESFEESSFEESAESDLKNRSVLKRSQAQKKKGVPTDGTHSIKEGHSKRPISSPFRFSLRRNRSKNANDVFKDIAMSEHTDAGEWNDADFKAAFDLFDRNHDGTITTDEVKVVLQTLGQSTTDDELADIMAEIDANGDGKISMNEFKSVIQRILESNEFHDKQFVQETFNDFDIFGDGFIGREDLIVVFKKLGYYEITNEEVDEMLRDATSNPQRKVNVEEFRAVIKGSSIKEHHISGRASRQTNSRT